MKRGKDDRFHHIFKKIAEEEGLPIKVVRDICMSSFRYTKKKLKEEGGVNNVVRINGLGQFQHMAYRTKNILDFKENGFNKSKTEQEKL
tara:strand:- start:812 stop:1078 length:267 start_codon:yes stop_codon:yes gene_type:complete